MWKAGLGQLQQARVLERELMQALQAAASGFARQPSLPLPGLIRLLFAVYDSGSNSSALFLQEKDGCE